MRRFVTLVVLLLFSIPFGVSISGCSKVVAPVYCNGGDSGIDTAQVTTITLSPIVYGVSLNYAQIGQVNSPSATNCKGSGLSAGSITYGTSDMTIADVQPATGRLCGGTWNRNSGGGIPDFTYCNPTNKSGTAYITASGAGVTSNPLPVFVHPVVTSIVLAGQPTSNCTTDPTTACCPLTTVGSPTAAAYPANTCISQGQTAQLVARIYAGTGATQANISCQAGYLQYSASGTVVSIDSNGVATANQPGSVLITASIADAASSAGYFSTCPPASITLTTPGVTTSPVVVDQNNPQALLATVLDTNGVSLTGLALEYESTQPNTIPAGSGSITPTLAGAASITALCQPPGCNPSAYNQIGLYGNGKPVASNSVNILSPGTNGTVLYMASTQSLYVESRDFTQTALAAPILLPYMPNSMVITNDGSTIYMGSSSGLMVLNAVNSLAVTRTDTTSPGTVLAVSPDGTSVILSDPVKQVITLESSSGSVVSTYGGVGTHAEYSPDSQSVYVAAGNQLLVYSDYTGWTNISPATTAGTPVTDVAVTVPAVGAYFAGATTTARSYCAISTPATTPQTEINSFYPPADSSAAITDRLAATNDGLHILGATVTPAATLNDLRVDIPAGNVNGPTVSVACPLTGILSFSNTVYPVSLTPIAATAITGVLPTPDSSIAFVTYTGAGGVLPAYAPVANGAGTTTYVPLSGTAIAPVAGVVSADSSTFYAGTTGDNLVHIITRSTLTDSSTLNPNLTSPGGAPVPVNLLVQKPRKTT
jgi:LysM repeat protein